MAATAAGGFSRYFGTGKSLSFVEGQVSVLKGHCLEFVTDGLWPGAEIELFCAYDRKRCIADFVATSIKSAANRIAQHTYF